MRKRVLVVEDNGDIREMMKTLLEFYGYEVIEASDGIQGVEMALAEEPDLIFMDISMPLLDGLQATAAIREHPQLTGIPIIAVTAFDTFYDEKARKAGCTDVIHKPLDFDRLRPLVQHYVA